MKRVISLILLCLVVGLVLSWFGATPSTLGVWFADTAENAWKALQDFFAWGGGYILMGAIVVIPFLAIRWLLGKRKRG